MEVDLAGDAGGDGEYVGDAKGGCAYDGDAGGDGEYTGDVGDSIEARCGDAGGELGGVGE